MACTTSQAPQWDVFLSFCGRDTRHSFISHLYAALVGQRIPTFKDDCQIRCGEVISDSLIQAIHRSKTHIVVFSKNFASSSWCLNELVEIYDYNETMKRSVIAVYYNIEPSVVRYQTGSFGKAFQKHQIRYGSDMEKVNRWRQTLQKVAAISGHCITVNKSEADIINNIVGGILLQVSPKTLYVTKYPVGLESRVRDITSLLSSGTEGVNRIGIYGMGGVGKTTLAKAVYNEIYHSFEGSCFLAEVREKSRTEEGLVRLQQKLLYDVLHKNINVDDSAQGIMLIKKRICSTKVLIVIDDLDDLKSLEFLEGTFDFGSVIIITTRNEELLDLLNIQYKYKVNELDHDESHQLLCKYAFTDDKISDTFKELSQEILECAGGLPLALKIFGTNLFKLSEEGWKWFLDKLKRAPYEDVVKILLISFHALESVYYQLQDIFLDIACFFIGWEEEEVVKIMDTCYKFANYNINLLKKRCLLTNNKREKLGMHHLLQDMGREIARNNSYDEPGKHSRLWASKDICQVLESQKGTNAIEGIIPHNLHYQNALEGVSFATKTFKRMNKLRFLYLENVSLAGSFEKKFEDLRLLHWKFCPLICLPSDFYPQKLVILELPHSKMRTMWKLNMASHVFDELRTLNMSDSLDLTTTPDFTNLHCLETLNLEGCKSLEEVHISIGSLASLFVLNLGGCVNLKSLPDTICNLRALKFLSIDNCSSLEALPIELGNIESLIEFSAKALTISNLPISIGHLGKLVALTLSNNKNLETLPDSICSMISLEILNISRCKKLGKATRLKMQDSSQIASSLQKLDMSEKVCSALPSGICKEKDANHEHFDHIDSFHLVSFAELPPNLKCIQANGCTSIERLSGLTNLKQLEILELTDCSGLIEIHGLEELTSLRELHVGGCHSSLLAYTFTEHFLQDLVNLNILRS